MTIATIIPKKVTGSEDLIVLPRSEFEKLQKRLLIGPVLSGYETTYFNGRQYKISVFQLRGRSALRLDRRVKKALEEHKNGKTKLIGSLADLR